MKNNVDKYAYRVIWSKEDDEYVGLCTEFNGLSWLADTQEKALKGIRKVVQTVVDSMIKDKEKIPEPLSEKNYSGKFQIRITPEQHRHLALLAAEQNVSLNRLISGRLV